MGCGLTDVKRFYASCAVFSARTIKADRLRKSGLQEELRPERQKEQARYVRQGTQKFNETTEDIEPRQKEAIWGRYPASLCKFTRWFFAARRPLHHAEAITPPRCGPRHEIDGVDSSPFAIIPTNFPWRHLSIGRSAFAASVEARCGRGCCHPAGAGGVWWAGWKVMQSSKQCLSR